MKARERMIPELVLIESTVPSRPDACWLWRGRANKSGYASICGRPAHRLSYEMFVGPIPVGLEIDHVCHNRDAACPGSTDCLHKRCINPRHLEPVTRGENHRRALALGRRPQSSWKEVGFDRARALREQRAAAYIAAQNGT